MEHSRIIIPPLTAEEQEYKRIYLQYPQARLDQAKTLKEIHALVPELAKRGEAPTKLSAQDNLHEQYFPPELDVLVVPNYRYGAAFLHSHSFFEVICVLNGECDNFFSSSTIRMTAGDICIVAPGTVHALSAFHDDCLIYNLTVRSSTFEGTFLKTMPQGSVLSRFFIRSLYDAGKESHLYFRASPDWKLSNLVLQMREEFLQQKQYSGTLLNALLTAFFVCLLRYHEKDVVLPNANSLKIEGNLIFILKYIEQHYRSLTLKELSDFFGYSERQMIRVLQTYTGESFRSLIQTAKLSRACELLRHPEIPINDIVSEVGYSNASHFYELFQRKHGITPAEYRRKNAVEDFQVLQGEEN